jgi:uncharacterized membrane protein
MKGLSGLLVVLTSLLCALSAPASADSGYRLVPITDGSGPTDLIVTDLNRRGTVVGARSTASGLRAFRWRAGEFTDLHDLIDPTSSFTEAAGINGRLTIVGVRYNTTTESFEGILMRGSQVSPLTVVAGETQVFPSDINNRGQIIVDSFGGAQSGSFLIDGDNVQFLEGLPGGTDSMHALAINERGAIAGNTQTAAGGRAVLWQDGVIMDLGVVAGAASSFASALNIHQQVVGSVSIGGASQAMRWQDGVMSLLPQLARGQASNASSINDRGVIVGTTIILQPESRTTATRWLGDRVVELDSLVRTDDPLKSFVHLESAEQINDRGDIVATGFDLRTPDVRTTYFMTLFDN